MADSLAPDDIRLVADALRRARKVVVSSGAGMSAESGVETFRDQDGLWSKFDPDELATLAGFRRNPARVWAWYRARRQQLARVEPHVGHRLLATWQERVDQLVVVTQNVDGLHRRAGSRSVVELHGRLDVVRCVDCGGERQTLEDLGPEPRCDVCGGRLRPGVVWFGEQIPEIEAAFAHARDCDLMLVIGVSGQVEPAASLADVARHGGATLVEVNPQATTRSALMHVRLRAACGPALAEIERAWAVAAS